MTHASGEGWLEASDFADARRRLVAGTSTWVGALGTALYLIYAVVDSLVYGMGYFVATDLAVLAVFGTTLLVSRQRRERPRTASLAVVGSLVAVFLSIAIITLYQPGYLHTQSYLVLLIAIGLFVLSWPIFLAFTAIVVATWAGLAFALHEPVLPSTLDMLLPGIALGVLCHGFRMRTYRRLYDAHAQVLATQAALRRQERLSALGTLVSGVAHEINNPLAYITGNVELNDLDLADLAARPALHADDAALLADMRERNADARAGLERIAHVVRGLRMVARENADGARAPVRLDLIAKEVLHVARSRIPKHVAVEARLDEPCEAAASEGEISQLLLHLILNAAQAMESTQDARLTVAITPSADTIAIEVADTGTGIAPEMERRLFTPFATTKRDATGLGLSICEGIVRAHGGEIAYRTRGGEGTTFTVTLPRARAAQKPAVTLPAAMPVAVPSP